MKEERRRQATLSTMLGFAAMARHMMVKGPYRGSHIHQSISVICKIPHIHWGRASEW